jgi:hypothetical protein
MLLSALIGLSLLTPGGEGRRLAIIGVLLALWPFLRSRKPAEDAGAAAPSMPPIMLLNLAPGDTVEDIESAPPLGSQDEVREQIAAVLPGITFDTEGRGTFAERTGAVDIDLRTAEPVYTAVLTIRGAAGPTVARLLGETRWRAFAPRLGEFVPVKHLRKSRRW